jgi:hypothetical protein
MQRDYKAKRYIVILNFKKVGFELHTNSLKVAKRLASLKIWWYAKIHDMKAEDAEYPWSKCIYINDRRRL